MVMIRIKNEITMKDNEASGMPGQSHLLNISTSNEDFASAGETRRWVGIEKIKHHLDVNHEETSHNFSSQIKKCEK